MYPLKFSNGKREGGKSHILVVNAIIVLKGGHAIVLLCFDIDFIVSFYHIKYLE